MTIRRLGREKEASQMARKIENLCLGDIGLFLLHRLEFRARVRVSAISSQVAPIPQ